MEGGNRSFTAFHILNKKKHKFSSKLFTCAATILRQCSIKQLCAIEDCIKPSFFLLKMLCYDTFRPVICYHQGNPPFTTQSYCWLYLYYVSCPTGQNANYRKSFTMAYLLILILAKLPRHKTETFATKQIEHQ